MTAAVSLLRDYRATGRAKAQPASGWRPNALLQATIDALSAHIAILDETGAVRAVNAAWRRGANGATGEDAGVGTHYAELCRRTAGDANEAAIVARGLGSVLSGARRQFTHVCPVSGGARWLQIRIGAFSAFGARRAVVAHEDVSDARRIDQELKKITGQLLEMQEAERRRIARELHDSTAQHLTVLGLGLMRVEQAAGDRPEALEAVRDMRAALDEAHREIRITSYLLHPPVLGEGGLVPALRRFAAGFARRTGLAIRFDAPDGFAMDQPEAEAALFRVVQEALTNVHRHAGATKVEIRLIVKRGLVILEIEDDGIGFDEAMRWEAGGALGVGVPGMQARVGQFGGILDIRSGLRGGTVVRASLPLGRGRRMRSASENSLAGHEALT